MVSVVGLSVCVQCAYNAMRMHFLCIEEDAKRQNKNVHLNDRDVTSRLRRGTSAHQCAFSHISRLIYFVVFVTTLLLLVKQIGHLIELAHTHAIATHNILMREIKMCIAIALKFRVVTCSKPLE